MRFLFVHVYFFVSYLYIRVDHVLFTHSTSVIHSERNGASEGANNENEW